jgi:two-component system uhpT operon response regulator UhpA
MTLVLQQRAGAEATAKAERAIRVAVVDDHRLVLDGLAAHLKALDGISVVAAEPTWMGLLAHPRFPVDVVVLDLQLNDDIPVATKLKVLGSAGVRAVVMSRHADAISIQSAMHAGALSFVAKTAHADELVAAIRAAARGRRHGTPSTAAAAIAQSRATAPAVGLGQQELRALMLYSSGRTVKDVAAEMETTEETIKSYLKRARRKYLASGIDLGSRALLRRHAIREGWIPAD